MKTETGVVGFAFLLAHVFMSALVTVPQCKSKWFDANNKMRLYGNNKVSMVSRVIAFTFLIVLQNLIFDWGGIIDETKEFSCVSFSHCIFYCCFSRDHDGVQGIEQTFLLSHCKEGLRVVAAHIFLIISGTKKRSRKDM